MQYFKRSLTGNIPNPDAHTAANEHTHGDEYANGDANSDDHTIANGDKHTTAGDSGSNVNPDKHPNNRTHTVVGLTPKSETRPRESGVVVLTLLAPANQLAYNPI